MEQRYIKYPTFTFTFFFTIFSFNFIHIFDVKHDMMDKHTDTHTHTHTHTVHYYVTGPFVQSSSRSHYARSGQTPKVNSQELLWNKLPLTVRSKPTIDSFRAALLQLPGSVEKYF